MEHRRARYVRPFSVCSISGETDLLCSYLSSTANVAARDGRDLRLVRRARRVRHRTSTIASVFELSRRGRWNIRVIQTDELNAIGWPRSMMPYWQLVDIVQQKKVSKEAVHVKYVLSKSNIIVAME